MKARKPTSIETQIFTKLLSVEFPNRDVLKAQLSNCLVEDVDNGYSIEIYPDRTSPCVEKGDSIPVETEYADIDGAEVSILLFVSGKTGFAYRLEFYKHNGERILSYPDVGALKVYPYGTLGLS